MEGMIFMGIFFPLIFNSFSFFLSLEKKLLIFGVSIPMVCILLDGK